MILKAERISKNFSRQGREFPVLKETDFRLKEGCLCILQGKSGSGKTTLLNILSGILSPTSGRVSLDGTELYAMNDRALSRFRAEHFGIIPQGQSAVSALTVLENILLPASIARQAGVSEDDVTGRARELMEKIRISELADSLPRDLSGGELRRMAIARALIRDPQVIFADEPTGDLDRENTDAVFRILKEAAQAGKAVLIVTHEQCAGEYADEMYRMADGACALLA